MRHALLRTAAVCLSLATAQPAWADLADGRSRLRAGDYAGAITELGKVAGKDRAAARLLLVEAQLATGDLAGAEATAGALASDKDPAVAGAAQVAQAHALRLRGERDRARQLVEPAAGRGDLAARHALAVVLEETGDRKGARALWDGIMAQYDAGTLDVDDPGQLFFLGEAARATAQFQFANDAYREAAALAPEVTRTGVAWAYLFLQKYATGDAEAALEEVFKVNPRDPDAHAAMAQTILDGTYQLASVRHHLEQAFAVNPRHLRALLVRASIEIDQNQWTHARATLEQVLAVNPRHAEAVAMLATIAWLRDDAAGYEARRKEALAIDPDYAGFYRVVARSAVREHRYVEAVELEKQAVAMDPESYEAMAGVGEGYLRLGMEKEGLEWLERSWKGDEYNARTLNTLELFEKTIPKEYGFRTTRNFKLRYHVDEQRLLSRYVEPVLERAFGLMVKRYGFEPKTPVTIELYADQTDYSVRTVGLPNLGALGVCFGQVITAMSPSNGDINWGMVLWHELAHVFHIQLSNSRVPRWFTEGLAEFETLTARPEWRRENDADLYGALQEGRLPSVAELNYEFMNSDGNAVVVAYYLSAVTIEYLVAVHGWPAIPRALRLFGDGKETPEVIAAITGQAVPEFDAAFRAWLERRLAPYRGTFHLPSRGFDDVTALEIAADAAPRDAARRAAAALGHFYQGNAEPAAAHAEAALALDPAQPIARYVLAEVELRTGRTAEATARLRAMVADGIDSHELRSRLAQLATAAGQLDEAERQLCAAKRLDPERSAPYWDLYELYRGQGRLPDALAELEHFAMLEQMQLAPVKTLVTEHARLGNWAKVRTYGELAVFISPFDPEVLLPLARAHLELGDPAQALFGYDSALLSTPPLRRPALAHLGRARALLAKGDKKQARAALAKARETEPEHAEVVELSRTLK